MELATRKMTDFQKEAEHNELVKELKAARREQVHSFWSRLFGQNRQKPESQLVKAPAKPVLRQSSSTAPENK